MVQITKTTKEALIKYFNTLSTLGYTKHMDSKQLVILTFIEELLMGELSQFITEDDYKVITDSLYCLIGNNCFIEFPICESYDTLFNKNGTSNQLRATQNTNLRHTEISEFRI